MLNALSDTAFLAFSPRVKLVQILAQSHCRHIPTSPRTLFSLPDFVAVFRVIGTGGTCILARDGFRY